MIALVAGLARAATLIVAADGTGDFTSIQAAIDAASAGDTIQVRNGSYTEGRYIASILGVHLEIAKSITLVGESVDGVVVHSNQPTRGRNAAIYFSDGTYAATVDGMTFDHPTPGSEAGIYAYSAVQVGGNYHGAHGTIEVRDVVFRMRGAHAKALTYVNSDNTRFTLRHVTADFGPTAGAFAYVNYVDPASLVVDSILLNASCGWVNFGVGAGQQYQVRYTDTFGCAPPAGTGNVNVNPLVVDAAGGDYRLQPASPVRDIAGEAPLLDPEGGPADLGALGVARDAPDALDWLTGTAVRVTNTGATVAFEDVDDVGSDEDVNDLVVRYVASCRVSTVGATLLDQRIAFSAVAAGATKTNALELVSADVPTRAAWSIDGGAEEELCGPATEPCGPVLRLYDDFRDAFAAPPDAYVNTQGGPTAAALGHVLALTWDAGPTVGGACPEPALRLRRDDDAVTVDLTSTTVDGVPLGGRFPGDWAVPTERRPIANAYPQLTTWLDEVTAGCSGPCPHASWYTAPAAGGVVIRGDLAATAPVAPPPTCTDGSQNGDERGVDCGGSVCPRCD